MKSKANFKSHPLHPILVSLPIAFFIGTFAFDCIGWIRNREPFFTTGGYLNIAGVITALLAAIPGFIDYIYTVPPDSSAKKRATKHALINITVVILFSIIALLRSWDNVLLVIALDLVGIGLLSVAGWLGGTLVYRNQIGVDIRYADAGKWREEYIAEKNGRVAVAKIDELKLNQMKLVHVNGKRIVVAKTEKGHTAFDDRCSHRGGSLAGGSLICSIVQCPWHGSQFNILTGQVVNGPALEKIHVYEIVEENNYVFLILNRG